MFGFACMYIPPTGDRKDFVFTKLAASKLDLMSDADAEDRVFRGVTQNIQALRKVLKVISQWPEKLRMFRISSDLLPLYTHPKYSRLYSEFSFHMYLSSTLPKLGQFARKNNIKLSMHPGQFVCLASDREDVVANSVQEIEYHADVVALMGYGRAGYNDFKINIHCSGKLGPDGFRRSFDLLSPLARNCLTVENAEVSVGLDRILKDRLDKLLPVVLDIHHHWCMTGEHISATDSRVLRVYDSWSSRPTLHYSCPSEAIFYPEADFLPDHASLVEGHGSQALRAHSNQFKNLHLNKWALSFEDKFDIMCEAKSKNSAQLQLYTVWSKLRRSAQL